METNPPMGKVWTPIVLKKKKTLELAVQRSNPVLSLDPRTNLSMVLIPQKRVSWKKSLVPCKLAVWPGAGPSCFPPDQRADDHRLSVLDWHSLDRWCPSLQWGQNKPGCFLPDSPSGGWGLPWRQVFGAGGTLVFKMPSLSTVKQDLGHAQDSDIAEPQPSLPRWYGLHQCPYIVRCNHATLFDSEDE